MGEALQASLNKDFDFDIEITNFAIGEIDNLIEAVPEETGDPVDNVLPDLDEKAPRRNPGDIW